MRITLIDDDMLFTFIEMLCSVILVVHSLIALIINLIEHIKQTKK